MNNNLNYKEGYDRAKEVGEPFVKAAIEELGYKVVSATRDEDFKHIDLKVKIGDNKYINIDVKENSLERRNSSNFTFTYYSRTGVYFKFIKDGRFAFIDDVDKKIYFVRHSYIANYIRKNGCIRLKSENNPSCFALIKKEDLENDAKIVTPSDEVKKLLK